MFIVFQKALQSLTRSLHGLFLGEILYDRLDLLLGSLISFSLYWYLQKGYLKSQTAVVSGIFFKLVPALTLPLFFTALLREQKKGFLFKQMKSFLFLFSGFFFINWILFGTNFLSFLTYHENRGIQIESVWASLYYMLHVFLPDTFSQVRLNFNYGCFQLDNQIPILNILARYFYLGFLSLFYLLTLFKWDQKKLPRFFFLTLLIFMTFGKVFSTQFLVWLVCVLPFCNFDIRKKMDLFVLVLLFVATVITACVYHDYFSLRDANSILWPLLALRNSLMVLLTFSVFSNLFLNPHSSAAAKEP